MSEIKISLFKPSRNGKTGIKPHDTDFYTEMEKIQNGTHWSVIKKLREITDPIEKRTYKVSKLEGFTVSAYYKEGTERSIKNSIPSGLLSIDIDPGKNPSIVDWGEVRDMLFEFPEVVSAFLSASGNGVAFVVKINPKKLKDVFYSIKDELYDNFGLHIDSGCHDISRVRFVSHDHDVKIRHDYDSIPVKEPSQAYLMNKEAKENAKIEYTGEVGTANCERAWTYAVKAAEQKIGVFADGSKHSYLVALAGFCNTIGMDLTYCEQKVQETYQHQTEITLERLLKPIKNVYKAYAHKFNTYVRTVEIRRKSSQIVGEVVNNYVRKGVKIEEAQLDEIAQKLEANIEHVKEVVERTVDEYSEEKNAEAKEANKSYKQFWYVDEDNKVCISKYLFRDFLEAKGVWRYKFERDWILIRVVDQIVTEIQKDDLKAIVMGYIEDMREFEVWEVLANRVSSVFADDYLELVKPLVVDFYRDDKESVTVFYQNGIVKVTKDEITTVPWQEFEGYVWATRVLKRDVTLTTDWPKTWQSPFVKFLMNVCKKDKKRFSSIATAIGYMIHGYKSKSQCPAFILNDEVISDTPEGGTGKGLIMDAISRIRNVRVIDGKFFDFADRFRFQDVQPDDDIIYFDDVKKGFGFENLFSSITGGLSCETKGGRKIMIPFAESPKTAISTNYAIPGDGNSDRRRKFEVEITQYYSKSFTPNKEFGKDLFDDFDAEEWNDFDNFIFWSANLYLKEGLIEQELINQPLKKLYAKISHEMAEFMEEEYGYAGGTGYKFDQQDAYRKYMQAYPSKLGSKTFYNNMEYFYKHYEIPFERRKNGDVRYFYIGGYTD